MRNFLDGNLHVCTNGTEALEFLRQETKYGEAPKPSLVLLDLNMPQIDGWEVLRQMKADEKLRSIPVLVLTTSESQRDVNLAYQLGASCFLTKPQDLDEFFGLMAAIQEFWLKRAQFPDLPPIPTSIESLSALRKAES